MKAVSELPQFVRDLLASPPQRGEGLNLWLYRVARVLHPYRSAAEMVQLLAAATAGAPVKRGEIERAVKNSAATAWKPGGAVSTTISRVWPEINVNLRETVITSGLGFMDMWEASPAGFEGNPPYTEQIVDALFPGNPLLCVGKSKYSFHTRTREEWRGKLAKAQLIVPSPMTARTGRTQEGKESEHTLENTGPRRFLIIEQDSGDADQQAAVLLHLAERAPLVLAVHSGSKSIHGWFMAAGQSEERLLRFMRYAVSLGADHATWTRSQFVRMPDGTRDNGKRQIVHYFNPEAIQ